MTDTNRSARVRLLGPGKADGAYALRDFLERSAVDFET
jgi:hypothetical protein